MQNDKKATQGCLCGFLGDAKRECTCSPFQIQRYHAKVSGPLSDRIDLHLEVPAVPYRELPGNAAGDPSKVIKRRVEQARSIQRKRFGRDRIHANARMKNRHITKYCKLDNASMSLLERAMESMGLSARAGAWIETKISRYARNDSLVVSRAIADLGGSETVK